MNSARHNETMLLRLFDTLYSERCITCSFPRVCPSRSVFIAIMCQAPTAWALSIPPIPSSHWFHWRPCFLFHDIDPNIMVCHYLDRCEVISYLLEVLHSGRHELTKKSSFSSILSSTSLCDPWAQPHFKNWGCPACLPPTVPSYLSFPLFLFPGPTPYEV